MIIKTNYQPSDITTLIQNYFLIRIPIVNSQFENTNITTQNH